MNTHYHHSTMAFVWRSEDIRADIVSACADASARAIFDLRGLPPDSLVAELKHAFVEEVIVEAGDTLRPDDMATLKTAGVKVLWIHYHPLLFPDGPDTFLNRAAELSQDFTCIPVTGDLSLISAVMSGASTIPAIAIKGSEASGFVSRETSHILFSTIQAQCGACEARPKVIIWGGVATPEAAAAFLTCGCDLIVFESLHWLTDLSGLDPLRVKKLENLRPDHTTLIENGLGLHYRLFDKGNSNTVKELNDLIAREATESAGNDHRPALQRIIDTEVHPLASEFSRHQLIPLGPEAAFAGSFVERYGRGFTRAVRAFSDDTLAVCSTAGERLACFADSPIAGELGTAYPFIQGGMSWISDVPEFALQVSDAGGLPTIALGLHSRSTLETKLAPLKTVLGSRTFALNFVALPENPYLEEQILLIEALKPPFIVIAAGDPSYAERFKRSDIECIYIAPDQGLLQLALNAGIRWVVLEGHEAGGHVGRHSTLTLAQIALDLRRHEPSLFRDTHLILAGGIFNRQTAFWAAMLGADGIQMGTAYLATEEIVATGALSPLYQRLIRESKPGDTTVSGKSVGLNVRALETPKVRAIMALERDMAGKEDEAVIRRQLETLAAGSLLLAARGQTNPDGETRPEPECLESGQFMSGAGAGVLDRVTTIQALHEELAHGELSLRAFKQEAAADIEPPRPGRTTPRYRAARDRVAITGMALLNSLGTTLDEVWAETLAMKCGITRVPSSKWDHDRIFDPKPGTPGKSYSDIGAFQSSSISRRDIQVAPQDFRTMSGSTRVTLQLARAAIMRSGLHQSDIPGHRVGVIVSQNSGEAASTLRDVIIGTNAETLIRSLNGDLRLTPEMEAKLAGRLTAGRLQIDDTTLLGRLNSAAGGFICNQFNFRGPTYSVAAACASSLVALFSAIQMIRNGVIDAAVIGGGEELLTMEHYIEFSAIGSLAGITGKRFAPVESSRPFDTGRSGMVLGEGGGVIVIERESLAKKRGAAIHAYITGVGASNNDQGMVESLAEAQIFAMDASFKDAGYDSTSVDLVECHATSTIQGDVEEFKALQSIFSQGRPTVLAAYKSQIGHTLGASGVSSLIRGVLAMQNGLFPGTLNYTHPDPDIDLESWGFRVLGQPGDWPAPRSHPRRLMANAFGFGGANYVVQLEEALEGSDVVLVSPESSRGPDAFVTTRAPGVFSFTADRSGRLYRVGVAADDVSPAREMVNGFSDPAQVLDDSRKRALARGGLFFHPSDEPPPPLALVFTGQGSAYPGMGRALYDAHPNIREWMDRIASLAGFDLLQAMFEPREGQIQNTLYQQPALFCFEYAVARLLMDLGVRPAVLAGHSVGEIIALSLSGSIGWRDCFHLVTKRAELMAGAAERVDDPGTMLATNTPVSELEQLTRIGDDIHITNYNSPHQLVLGGPQKDIKAIKEKLENMGHWVALLNVSMAFHSPIMKSIRRDMSDFLDTIEIRPPIIPVVSNTSNELYPDDPSLVRQLIIDHLESPVHWMQNVQFIRDHFRIRHFLEVGPKGVLSRLIEEVIDRPVCMETGRQGDEVGTFQKTAAQLTAFGHISSSARATTGTGTLRQTTPPVAAGAIRREIRNFLDQSFGGFMQPSMLEAVLRDMESAFSDDRIGKLAASTGPAPAPVVQSAEPASLPPSATTPPARPAAHPGDLMERFIHIIMEATGYERDEIDPDMDLRTDLSIRSSRLPLIMDAAEKRFGISIEIEDFIGLHTIRELAGRIRELTGRDKETPPDRPADMTTPVETEPAAVEATALGPDDLMERFIHIIMEATGYERDEIDPDMDLRTDLSIRSSRLPLIMDAAEKRFGISIEIEDFIGLHTIRELAGRIRELTGRDKETPPDRPAVTTKPVETEPAAVEATALGPDDLMERFIHIIMEATGYERDEIDPDMDLRTDLSIRSSRLPLIMDAAEKRFGISIEIEDFIGLQTIGELVGRIRELTGRDKEAPPDRPAVTTTPVETEPAAVEATALGPDDLMERFIHIIMEATGYERDEIDPDMDLRTDLSIRSSRLPLIVDAAEKRFGISIQLEDFIGLRTAREMSLRIKGLMAEGRAPMAPEAAPDDHPKRPAGASSKEAAAQINRFVFKEIPIESLPDNPIAFADGDEVAVLAHPGAIEAAQEVESFLGSCSKANIFRLELSGEFDIRKKSGAEKLLGRLSGSRALAGLILVQDQAPSEESAEAGEVVSFLTGLLGCVQALVRSSKKKVVLSIQREASPGECSVLAEGVLGMFLSAAHEYASVLFRCLTVGDRTPLSDALGRALTPDYGHIRMICRGDEVSTIGAVVSASHIKGATRPPASRGDVIVITGGARGVTSHLARSLAPLAPNIAILGRGPADDPEIRSSLERMAALGVAADYYPCDVSDPRAVERVCGEIVKRHGRVDGVLHGAGVIRDSFVESMTPQAFQEVMAVKLIGLSGLFRAFRDHGLKYVYALSSIAAIQGNAGQVNYSAANRSMSAYMVRMTDERPDLAAKAIVLPPIKGTGMADNEDVETLLKLRGLGDAYIHVNELTELFQRELRLGRTDDTPVMFARLLPEVKTALIQAAPAPDPETLCGAGVCFSRSEMPMIDRIEKIDLSRRSLEATRPFSIAHDVWLEDHRPFNLFKHPLVSGVMAVETLLEAARALYPHLHPVGVQGVKYLDVLECPPGIARNTRIQCHCLNSDNGVVRNQVTLASRDVTPSGRLLDRWSTNYQGEVILGTEPMEPEPWAGFSVRAEELTTPGLDREKIEALYASGTGLKGRYRVMSALTGAGPEVIAGRAVYPQGADFSGAVDAQYQYSPYLLEALWHLAIFHQLLIRPGQARIGIPVGVGDLRFNRLCRPGEPVIVEGRLMEITEDGPVWDARAVDDQGKPLVQAQGLTLKWIDV